MFKLVGNERQPRRIYDFATGSGGFLVEAARRIIDEGGIDENDVEGIQEALGAIVTGFHGTEISPFPYYLTEINLLLQVSRLLGMMRAAGHHPPAFALGVVHTDSLTTRDLGSVSIEGLAAAERADSAELEQDERFGLVPLDAEKRAAFSRIRENESFDLVVGNPPYVFETNNRVLFERLRGIHAWADDYRGKSDYLYYFLTLAAEKVRIGGRLCVITPAGWMNAGNADWLRERLAATLTLDELFLFGSYRLFAPEREARGRRYRAPTPTVESAILVATRQAAPKGHKLRVVALEDESEAAAKLGGGTDTVPDRDALLDEMTRRAAGRQGRRAGIHVHDVQQGELVASRPWPIKHSSKDVPARAVAHLQQELDRGGHVERLAERWHVFQGVQTGADAYTPRIRKRLRDSFPGAYKALEDSDAVVGEPILELSAGAEDEAPWSENRHLLARSIEPDAILWGALDESRYTNLVWIGRDDGVPDSVVAELERWRPVLENRADFLDNPDRRWFETHRTREQQELRKPKVIALYRTDRGRFAVDEEGAWQPSIKTTLATPREEGLSVAYLCGLLNSELLDVWYAVRGKTPWHVRRNYEPKPMNELPYRHIPHREVTDRTRLGKLSAALEGDELSTAGDLVAAIASSTRAAPADAAEAAAAVEILVRRLAENRRSLLPFRDHFPALARVVKNPWSAPDVEPDPAAFLASMPASETTSVRIDPHLSVTIDSNGPLGKPKLDQGAIIFRHQRKQTALISGPTDRLELLQSLLAATKKPMPENVLELLLPKDMEVLRRRIASDSREVQDALTAGRRMVEMVERLVCALYAVPEDLTEEIITHAIDRAKA